MTTTYTKFTTKELFRESVNKAALDFRLNAFKNKFDSVDLLPVNIADGFQLINSIAEKNSWSDIVRKLFIQNFLIAEQKVKGSGIVSVYFLCLKILNEKTATVKDLKHSSRACASWEALESVKEILDHDFATMFCSVIKEIGIFGTISIMRTMKATPVLEINSGHHFSVGIDPSFPVEKIRYDEAKLVAVDGAIVDVSEIDYLLQDLSRDMTPCVIIARSFSSDILNTLSVNYRRGTLKVIPISVSDSISNVNVIGDVSVGAGADLISADTGKRINSFRLDDCTTISNVIMDSRKFVFDSKPSQKIAVQSRIESINKKIDFAIWDDKMSAEDVRVAYSHRIDSLSSNSIKLWVPGDENYLNYVKKNFKFGIDYISSFANTGKISSSKVVSDSTLPEILPAGVIESALAVSESIFDSITGVGGCVEISRNG